LTVPAQIRDRVERKPVTPDREDLLGGVGFENSSARGRRGAVSDENWDVQKNSGDCWKVIAQK
jgi:hypothetical protein